MKNSRKQKKRRKEYEIVKVTICLLKSKDGDSNYKEKREGHSLQKQAIPFRFAHDTDFTTLVKMIATQLHVDQSRSLEVSKWKLLLGGKHMLEDSSEIEDGDHLVLDCGDGSQGGNDDRAGSETGNQAIHEENDDSEGEENNKCINNVDNLKSDESESEREWEWESDMEGVKNESSSMSNSSKDNEDSSDSYDDSDDDDDEVEDVTDKYKAAMDSKKDKLLRQAEFLSDDDENDSSQSSEEFGIRNRSLGNQNSATTKRKIKKEKSASQRKKNQPTTKRPRKSSNKEKNPSESPIQVLMEEKDIPPAPGRPNQPDEDISNSMGFTAASTVSPNDENTGTSDATKKRIVKLLNTGFHSNSNEHEAKNAMKLARRLMERHNLSQALLLQEHADSESKQNAESELKGGMVTVKVVHRKTRKPMGYMVRWVDNLIHPVCLNFKVKAFKTVSRRRKCSVTFYGIYTSAQLAGYAFKIACERISLMSSCYCVSEKGAKARAAKLSYAIGIVDGLTDDINEERWEMHEKEECTALVLAEHREKVEEDIVKKAKWNLFTTAQPKQLSLNQRAYKKGVKDSKEIDLDQRAIRDKADRVKSEIRSRSKL